MLLAFLFQDNVVAQKDVSIATSRAEPVVCFPFQENRREFSVCITLETRCVKILSSYFLEGTETKRILSARRIVQRALNFSAIRSWVASWIHIVWTNNANVEIFVFLFILSLPLYERIDPNANRTLTNVVFVFITVYTSLEF